MKMRPMIAATAFLLPFAALAAGQTMPATPAGQNVSFEALDANKDGRISMPEASADPALVEGFSSADRNGDGYLDNAEYDRAVKKARRGSK